MATSAFIGFSDAETATLADIVHAASAASADAAAAQARMSRALARALELAEQHTAHASSSVKATEMALRAIAAELAGAIRSSDRSVQRQINDAGLLVDGFPATLDAWEAGTITRAHVQLITELGRPLPPEVRAEFEQLALIRCEDETAGRLRAELAILAERLHPRTLTERHAEAREDRCIRTFVVGDGMSGLTLIAPTLHIDAIYDRLTRQAAATVDARTQARERVRARAAAQTRAAGGTGVGVGVGASDQDEIVASDERTVDQLRVDLLTDMLLTAQPGADPTRTDDGPGTLGAIRAKVQVVVPALTLLGADEHPADLVGRSPIDAATARAIAGAVNSAWDRLITDPVTGAVLHTDSRFASDPMRRFLTARDRHCRFPGCRVPAIRCEIDHTIDHHLGGPTDVENCEGLCQRHHSMKQFTAWRVRQLGGGVLEWTSPLGTTYIDTPPAPTVHFIPDDPGGPPPGVEPGGPPPDRLPQF
ncbi:HNH endonuclease signature motif containing protein [Microbacterium sp. cx-59]|uniref:HNH endonuclease signature motif containing protein n=1 Tax=Microbacterium sp. cx-59 TaxID=2891207 RepID=UPI001E47B562|nr:HNH endonuclease signature motif containing protein [Microbacterium sp. cx-59]MCC4908117.1 HNH endonuclease [Microbacterium sp. cx-59]